MTLLPGPRGESREVPEGQKGSAHVEGVVHDVGSPESLGKGEGSGSLRVGVVRTCSLREWLDTAGCMHSRCWLVDKESCTR